MPTERLLMPGSAREAVGLLQEHGPAMLVLAGGTIAMGLVNDGVIFPTLAMSLHSAGLDGVRQADGYVEIGATATLSSIIANNAVPLLAEAALQVGGWAVRNRATIGGNLFAAPPHGDVATALLALDADVIATGPERQRTIPLKDFYKGHLEFDLDDAELVTALRLPVPAGRGAFIKYGRRQANAPAVVAVAVRVVADAHGVVTGARIAMGAVHAFPLRVPHAESLLIGRPLDTASAAEAAEAAMEGCTPPSDALASAWYRRKMVGVFVRRALERLYDPQTQPRSIAQ